jgi:hypothetical protein
VFQILFGLHYGMWKPGFFGVERAWSEYELKFLFSSMHFFDGKRYLSLLCGKEFDSKRNNLVIFFGQFINQAIQ